MIFYEKERAEELLKSGFTSFMNFADLSLLARYFKYMGKNKTQIKNCLIEFCIKFVPDFNEVLSRNKIEDAIKMVDKYGIRLPVNVEVTKKELEIIKGCGDYKRQKILFVMLVIAKYFKYNNTKLTPNKSDKFDHSFYANEKITNTLKMAKVSIPKKERMDIQFGLQQLGLITTIGSDAFQINFVDEKSDAEIVVTDMNRLIDFYPFCCERCGKIIDKVKRSKLCNDCYLIYSRSLTKNRVKKFRNKSM